MSILNHLTRGFEILRKEGAVEFSKASTRFVLEGTMPPEVWRQYVKVRVWAKYGRHYDAPLDPFRVLWVDPNEVTYHQPVPKPAGGYSNRHYAVVLCGNWDKELPRFEEHFIYQFIYNRYERRMPAENTDFFELFEEKLSEQGTFWNGCESVEDFHKRCEYLDGLFKDIRENGIRTTEQLGSEALRSRGYPDNIHINIGRNGELIYLNGRHRLSMAKILDIEAIPVNVMVRHKEWQELRDGIYNNGLAEGRESLRDHPDLQDVLD